MNEVSHTGRPRVVIVGAGFGGLTVAKALADTPVDVTVIDQRNHHVFQPLLYQVATAALSPADIASPIRTILKGQRNTSVMLAKATGIDTDSGEVVAGDRRIPFDYLVLATGARHAYFGHDDWEAFAKGIKTIDDATGLRRRILLAFEKAEFETDPEERSRLLTFVVVGGGATGVEMAGAIAELAREALAADFRSIDPTHARIVLVEAGPRLLPVFEEHLSEAARCSLEELGVEVRVSTAVTGCDDAGVLLGDQRIGTRAILWAAGVQASLAGRWLGAETDRAGRVRVAPDLSVPGHPQIFVIGDTAHVLDMDGKPLPGVAPVAKQEGKYLAKLIRTRVAGGDLPPFRYRDPGALATIGRKRAVVQFRRLRLSGYLAWWLWSLAHIYFLIGFRNRLVVAMNWAWTYVSLQRGTRLITGSDPGLDQVASETAITKPHLKGVA
ncbi:NAD(P)/FAD-dependent oxidoreductase [Microvirga terrae]|uniref:NADH:ubiquinone reductase (non-electrogenic) n=1 Tax=Microvirga terrae TaxID=2740529 RepID=A0ABY5RW92_9HYPH|nr:NAD(P)/FAD-dependent oxidoreductase [Microvirga terrae]UVF21511.1 NAD(P)/FAD-dependent oxidoreductase [Microvirga terrae]